MTRSQGAVELTALPALVAPVVAGALRAEGIEVHTDRDALASVYGLDAGMHATRLLVAPHDLERARAVLAEIEAEDLEA